MGRALKDLYRRGRIVVLDDEEIEVDGDGNEVALEPAKVWLQKPSHIEFEAGQRAANAAKARVLALRRNTDSIEYLAITAPAESMTREELVDFLSMQAMVEKQPVIEAELAAEEEWSKDQYLEGLREAWVDLQVEYVGLPDEEKSPESKRVFAELQRFRDELDARASGVARAVAKDLEGASEERMRTQVIDTYLDLEASQAWLTEIRYQRLLYGVRDPENHSKRLLLTKDDLAELSDETRNRLLEEMEALVVDVLAGKGSLGSRASLPSAEQPELATGPSSGPEAPAP